MSRRIHLPAAEERLIEVAPGIKVRCWCHWQENRAQAMTLIVVHGLEGSSESQYMTGVARNGLSAGMNVVRMNQRNCGGMDYCAPTLYNSSLSGDVAAVAKSVQSPEFSTALANQSTEPTLMSPEQTAAFIRDEIVKWKKVVVAAGVKSE